MDIQEMITQLLGSAEKEPEILQELVEHPYSTIRKVTGLSPTQFVRESNREMEAPPPEEVTVPNTSASRG